MKYTTLGRTGLKVSVMGLGCGGKSRLGQRLGKSEADSIAIIRQAFENGVTYFDTAEAYHTEPLLGKAFSRRERESLVLTTKVTTDPTLTPSGLEESLERSLKNLRTDHIDIYQLHGVVNQNYDYLLEVIVPALQRQREKGKIRFLGLSEYFNGDPSHTLLERALKADCWDTMMVGFNIINQSAARTVLPAAIKKNIGVIVMFALRYAFSRPSRLRAIIADLIASGHLDARRINRENPLGFLLREYGLKSISEAAYRFCRDAPGTHVILSGTGHPQHLEDNIAALSGPPLPEEAISRLKDLFQKVDTVTGQ